MTLLDLSTDPTVIVLTSYSQFLAIESEWRELFEAAERPTPYQRYSWLKVCWNIVWRGPQNRLRVVLVRQGGRLVMAGAFVLGWRRLRPVAYMLGSTTPEYENLLWRAGPDTARHVGLLLEALGRELLLPRQLVLQQVLEDSPLLGAVHATAGAKLKQKTVSVRVPLHHFADFDAYFESLSKNLKVDHRRRLRSLAALPGHSLEVSAVADRAEIIDWALNRKREWLAETGQRAEWLRRGRIDDVFHALLAERGDVAEFWVSAIKAEGTIVAAALSFVEGDTVYYSKITHNPDYAKHSPARTLTLELVREAMRRGLRWFDLGQGNNDWKHRFSPQKHSVMRARVRLK